MSNSSNSNSMIIREASVGDVKLILTFIKELAEYERLAGEVVATEELIREALFGEKSNADAFIGYEGKAPVAFAITFHNLSSFLSRPGLYLEDLFVKPEKRGQGYGKQLLVFLANLAKERGCGRFEWAVLDWNVSAIKFYKSLGAVAMDEWTVYRLTGEALTKLAKSAN